MKRKPGPQKADRENPAWTKETFARAHKAREVLPEIFPAGTCCQDVEAPRTTEIGQGAYINLSPIAAGDIGALEGHGSWLANTDGRSIVESCLIDVQTVRRPHLASPVPLTAPDWSESHGWRARARVSHIDVSLRSLTWPHITL
jgi:hypothetical protein